MLYHKEYSKDKDDPITKPFLKWVGGKTQIIETLIEKFPEEINDYHEIFLGGGSVLLALLSHIKAGKIKVSGKIYAYDVNSPLIHTYKNIQTKHIELYHQLQDIINEFNNCKNDSKNRNPQTLEEAQSSKESYFYWIRNKYNNLDDEQKKTILGSSMFIFLNKTCFRGLFRIGPNGFNVSYGNYKNPKILDYDHLCEISLLIQNVNFCCFDFVESLKFVGDKDFVYLDPPYFPENYKSFTKYTENVFSNERHLELFDTLNHAEFKFLMSNSDAQQVRDKFLNAKFLTESISCKRSINSKNPGSKTNELLIRNY